jgi:hypothetical protein
MASVPPDPPPAGAPNGKTPQFAGFCFAAAFSGSVADADHCFASGLHDDDRYPRVIR